MVFQSIHHEISATESVIFFRFLKFHNSKALYVGNSKGCAGYHCISDILISEKSDFDPVRYQALFSSIIHTIFSFNEFTLKNYKITYI